jgi:hypothetical protein
MNDRQNDQGGRPQQPAPRPTYDPPPPPPRRGYQRQGLGEAMAKSFIRSVASSLGRILVRTITGGRR